MQAGLPEPWMVNKAVEIFVRHAYPRGAPSRVCAVVDSLNTPNSARNASDDFYANRNFVQDQTPSGPFYSLRLGNNGYLHSKLKIEPWTGGKRYVFRVDSHDKHVLIPRDHPDFEAMCQLRQSNQLVAEKIESAWQKAGLPTFIGCMQQEVDRRSRDALMEKDKPKIGTILVVDDEAEVVKSVKNLLRLDYRVLGTTRAAEAVEILQREEVHVIMTDQRMPDMTGVELLSNLRSKHPDAIRLLFTGYADIRAVIDAINQGNVYRYITKPWDPDELQIIIRDAFARHEMIVERKRLLQELQDKNAELKQSNELKSGFIKIASHEFRTPVNILRGLCTLSMRDPTINEVAKEHLIRIDRAALRLERLVNQTLSMLIAERLEGMFESRLEDMAALVTQAADDIRPFIALRNQKLEVDIGDLGKMSVDMKKLRDSLDHLLFNAIKFTPDGGQITLRAHREATGIRIQVADNGGGIAPECMARLFEPFFTGFDVSRHSSGVYEYGTRGLGLGLSVVKAFTQMHGGQVSAESEVGKGSTLSLFLPDKANVQSAANLVAVG